MTIQEIYVQIDVICNRMDAREQFLKEVADSVLENQEDDQRKLDALRLVLTQQTKAASKVSGPFLTSDFTNPLPVLAPEGKIVATKKRFTGAPPPGIKVSDFLFHICCPKAAKALEMVKRGVKSQEDFDLARDGCDDLRRAMGCSGDVRWALDFIGTKAREWRDKNPLDNCPVKTKPEDAQ